MKGLYSLGFSAVAGVASLLLATTSSQAQSRLQLDITPPIDEVVPFHQPITVSLETLDSGVSLDEATVHVKLLAPAKTPWLTTDFPIVEGTTLLDMAIAPLDGAAQFQIVPPIRGSYQLEVSVTPKAGESFEPFTEVLDLQIPENPAKLQNLLILLAILGMAGMGGGWVIGCRQSLEDGEIAPQPVRLLLSMGILLAIAALLYVSFTAETAEAHSSHTPDEISSRAEAQPHPESMTVSLDDLAMAKVGQTIPLMVELADAATGQPITDVDLAIATTLLDYDQTVAAFRATPDATGRYTWQQQFFDGSPHVVTVRVSPQPGAAMQFEPFELVKHIDAIGVAPPLSVRLISLGYLTAVLATGVGAGFWTRRRLQGSTP